MRPSGANFMITATMPNSTCDRPSMQPKHRRAARAQALQRESKQHREQQDLQNLAFGESVDHRGRDDVEQEIGRRLQFSRTGIRCHGRRIESAWIDIHAAAGLQRY